MNAEKFSFWQKWLTYANVMTVFVGLLVAFAGNSIFFSAHNQYTLEVFFGEHDFSPEVMRLKNWLFGIIGGTIVGFHILMVMISENAFKNKEPWAFKAMVIGLVSWFLIDSSVSIYYGAVHNVILINFVALLLIGLPLVKTRNIFLKD